MGNPCIKCIVCENLENKINIYMRGPLVGKGPQCMPLVSLWLETALHTAYISSSPRIIGDYCWLGHFLKHLFVPVGSSVARVFRGEIVVWNGGGYSIIDTAHNSVSDHMEIKTHRHHEKGQVEKYLACFSSGEGNRESNYRRNFWMA